MRLQRSQKDPLTISELAVLCRFQKFLLELVTPEFQKSQDRDSDEQRLTRKKMLLSRVQCMANRHSTCRSYRRPLMCHGDGTVGGTSWLASTV